MLAAAIFVADIRLLLDVDVPTLYVVVVLLGLWSPRGRFTVAVAAGATLLTLLAVGLSPRARPVLSFVDRALALTAVWAAALVVVRHKTVEKRLGEERRRAEVETLLESVIDSAPLALLAIDPSGSVTLAEGKGLERLGFPPDALRGHLALGRLRDLPWLEEPLRRALSGESATTTGRLGEQHLEVRGTPLRDAAGEVVGAVGVVVDVTERARAEAALRTQQALAHLGEMAAVVAHEVRNPLAGIRATLQILATRLPATDQPTVASLFARIDALNDLTQNLLLFARPRAPRLEPVSLRPLLREAAGLLTGDRHWSGVEVEVGGDDAFVRADPLLLRGVFLNLFLNAAQAMRGSGRIRVSFGPADGLGRVTIADAGPGVPGELLDRVFEPFFTTKHRGTGLGLPLVRRQVEAHGGEVSLTCPPEGGTVVTVVLPLAEPVKER